ncbi:MAG TPA: translation initiation factor IF-2 [Chloroflexota bacterium]|nr:translation initiation factor IF-2 [Chloroflexota bacterium]
MTKTSVASPAGGEGTGPIILPGELTVRELGEALHVSPIEIIKTLMKNGIMATINQQLDFDAAAVVANDLGIDVLEEGAVVEPEPEPEPEFDHLREFALDLEEPLDEAVLPESDVELDEAPKRRKRRRAAEPAEKPVPVVEVAEPATVVAQAEIEEPEEPPDPEESLVKRPPVVTVMGHVDHGKTALLDRIRSTNVVAGEAGGITQHIGAYQVEHNGEKITFLDTPGHAAFTAMRARGARVTDIAIVVVAASEGVMPQTLEAIDHARAAQVPIIVALNKMDLPEANPDRVKAELAETGLGLVEWGGDVELRAVSAKTGEGIDDLLETIILTAELADEGKGLRANPNRDASGTVIEARMDRQRGPLATLIVQRGTLKVGQFVAAGGVVGKARALTNDRGQQVKEAGPSTPVTILGLGEIPEAGDRFRVFASEREARATAGSRAIVMREVSLSRPQRTGAAVTDIFAQLQRGGAREINLVIKADVQGSLEAIVGALNEIDRDHQTAAQDGVPPPRLRILHASVGPITESDILLATASDAMVIGFNVSPDPAARKTIKADAVDVRQYNIIYKLTEDIEALLAGAVEPVYQEVVYGHAEVRQIFRIGRSAVAGGYVTDGRITRNSTIRVIRGGETIWTGQVASLKRFKDDVREVANGYEFGIALDGFIDFEEQDVLEAFGQERV